MLINRGLSKGTLTTFKLITGDELLATVEVENTDSYTISRPLVLVPAQQGLAMIPYIMSVTDDQTLDLAKKHVIVCAPTREEVVSSYIKATTGIETIR